MKAMFLKCAMLLALFAVPALADSITATFNFTNSGTVSGDLATGAVQSNVDKLTSDSAVVGPGPVGVITVKMGTVVGSVNAGGTFAAGSFTFVSKNATLVSGPMNGTWTKLASGGYELVGHFSGIRGGLHYTGATTQQFANNGGHFVAVSGTTTVTVTTAH